MSRRLPQDIPAEEALLGCILIQPGPVDELRHTVSPADFLKGLHRDLWSAILALHEEGQAIDAVTVAARANVDIADVAVLHAATPAVSRWKTYSRQVVDAARRRHLIMRLSELSTRAFESDDAVDDLLDDVRSITSDVLVGSRDADIAGLWSISDFMSQERSEQRATAYPWLIPGMLRRRWRVILVGGEGSGKGVFLRQIGMHAAAGRDPFEPDLRLSSRVKVLYVDLENSESTIEHQTALVNRQVNVDLPAEAGDHFVLWHRDSGMNIRQRVDQHRFESVLQSVRPDLVIVGPFYKLWARKPSDDLEQATIEVLGILDQWRTRYNFALMLEHHIPKAEGMWRSKDPFGSAALKRWPEMGRALVPDGLHDDPSVTDYFIERNRGDREPANWPDKIRRDVPLSAVAWTGTWEKGR